MNFIEKYNCILCKYNKYNKNGDSCFNHQEKDEYGYPIVECKSLSNVYYGTLIKYFPFKQIYNICTEITYKKEEKYNKEMNKKYGDYSLENDEIKFVWGMKSYDDLSGSEANLYTMNDIDIVYNKKENKYMLGIETAYIFENHADECSYLKNCLVAFTKYMDDNRLKKNKPYVLFMNDLCPSMKAKSIEELYANFKIFVNGFCNQDIDTHGCEYCDTGLPLAYGRTNSQTISIRYSNELIACAYDKRVASGKIKYCPMCGKKLKEE